MILGLGAAVLYLSGVQSARELTLRPEQLTIFGTLNPITGALALVFSHRAKQAGKQQYNAQQLRSALIQTTRFSGVHNPGPGHGLLDAEALFNLLK